MYASPKRLIAPALAVIVATAGLNCADDEAPEEGKRLEVFVQQVESPSQTVAVAWAQAYRDANFTGIPATYTDLPEGCTERTLRPDLLMPEVQGEVLNAGTIEVTGGDQTLTLSTDPDNRGGAYPSFGYGADSLPDIETTSDWQVSIAGGDDFGAASAAGTMPAAVEDVDVTVFDGERIRVDTSGSEPFNISITIEDPETEEFKTIRCNDIEQRFEWNFGDVQIEGAEVWRESVVDIDTDDGIGRFHLVQTQPLRPGDAEKTQWMEIIARQILEDGNYRLVFDAIGGRDITQQPTYGVGQQCVTRDATSELSFEDRLDAGEIDFTVGATVYTPDFDEFEYLGTGGPIDDPVTEWMVEAEGGSDVSSFSHENAFGYVPDDVTIDINEADESIDIGWSGTEPVDFGIIVDDGLTAVERRCYGMTGGSYSWDRALDTDIGERARVWVGTWGRQPIESWDATAINAVNWNTVRVRADTN